MYFPHKIVVLVILSKSLFLYNVEAYAITRFAMLVM